MTWKIEFDGDVEKDLRHIDRTVQKRIFKYLRETIMGYDDPRRFGKPLRGQLSNLWRYRVGNYRLICQILDNTLTVLVVHIAHRKDVYK